MAKPKVRTQEEYKPISAVEFEKRFLARFYDPAFNAVAGELEKVFRIAWDGFIKYRKLPRTEPGGKDFSDPEFPLGSGWLETRKQIAVAQVRHDAKKGPSRILLIIGSPRSEHSCPGEVSKTLRMAQSARETIEAVKGFEVDVLDLSEMIDEPLKVIHPCKGCVSTAMPLCHWPCSCYPNHAMGQAPDWMAEIYPRWVAAHGVMIVTPVHWYQAPSVLKLMMDRLVCADGGNPDPSTTEGKDPALAKAIELRGWDYPKHLAGRAFSVVVHADTVGSLGLRRNLSDWLTDMELIEAGPKAAIDTFIGYYKTYAKSHEELDKDPSVAELVYNAAMSLTTLVTQLRDGTYEAPGEGLEDPRAK